MWLERLNDMKKLQGLTTSEIQIESGVPLGTLNKLFAGQTKNPSLDTIKAVVYSLGYTLDDLDMDGSLNSGNSNNPHIEKYKELHEPRKEVVNAVIDVQHDQQTSEKPKRAKPAPRATANLTNPTPKPKKAPMREQEDNIVDIIEVVMSENKAAAGYGAFLDNEETHAVRVVNNFQTKRSDLLVPISGDSMEPDFKDGDIAMISKDEEIRIGDVGLFVIDGYGYIKELGEGNVLISLNEKYDDIPMNGSIHCYGKVIGIMNEKWFIKN